MHKLLYGNYIRTLSEKFERRLEDISAEINFELGDEFEIALCEILRSFLPNKYGICRGFVVDAIGNKKGDDIIIYDQERFPTLKINPKDNYSRLENIPIEAVYAYIEAKHTLNDESFDKALQQIIEVKELCLKREKRQILQYDNFIKPQGYINNLKHLPDFRNPVFTMIIGRFAVNKTNNKKSDNIDEIYDFLDNKLNTMPKSVYLPELIVAGKSNFLWSHYVDEIGISRPSLFYLLNNEKRKHENKMKENLAFGISLAHMMAALDFINLGKMPWEDIINDAKNNG